MRISPVEHERLKALAKSLRMGEAAIIRDAVNAWAESLSKAKVFNVKSDA